MSKKAATPLLILALLGAGAVTLYLGQRLLAPSSDIVEFERWVACEACGQVYWGVLESRPGKCSKCGRQALWPAAQCAKCGHKFAVSIQRLREQSPELRCPKCGSDAVGKVLDAPPK